MMKRIWKGFFPPLPVSHHTSPFPEIDLDSLRRELKVVEHAKTEGAKNLPDGHSVREASYEQTIVQAISSIASKTSRKLTAILKSHEQTAQLATAQYDRTALEGAVKAYETQVEALLLGATPEIEAAVRRVSQRKLELERFKTKHGLVREAEYPESAIFTWAILTTIVVMESILNGYFFAAGSDRGLLGGFGLAFIISLVNVSLAAAVALLPARLVIHRQFLLKSIGLMVTIAYFILLVFALLFLTQYRDAFTTNPDNALEIVFQKIDARDWKPGDIHSYLFFVLTLLFAIGAFVKVLYSDDLYIRYGSITRKVIAAENRISEYQEKLANALEKEKQLCLSRMKKFSEEIEYKINSIHDAVRSHDRLLAHWQGFSQDLVTSHDALVSDYRVANRKSRSNTPPQWFKERTVFDIAAYQPENQECKLPDGLPDLLNEYKQLEAEANASLGQSHNKILGQIQSMLASDQNGHKS